jgi:hypothetical protein
MTLPSGAVRDLTWKHMQGKCVSQCLPLPTTPDKLFRGRMIKRRQKSQICHGKEPLTNFWVTRENHSRNKCYCCFQNNQNPSFWAWLPWGDLNPSFPFFNYPWYFGRHTEVHR